VHTVQSPPQARKTSSCTPNLVRTRKGVKTKSSLRRRAATTFRRPPYRLSQAAMPNPHRRAPRPQRRTASGPVTVYRLTARKALEHSAILSLSDGSPLNKVLVYRDFIPSVGGSLRLAAWRSQTPNGFKDFVFRRSLRSSAARLQSFREDRV